MALVCFALLTGCLVPVDAGANDGGRCGPSNCAGCCDSAGVCQASAGNHCGAGGFACSICIGGSSCEAGQCVASARCTLPSSLDWEAVARGDTVARSIELENPTSAQVTATIGAVSGIGFSSSDAPQTIKLAAGAKQTVELRFAPLDAGAYVGRVIMRVSDSCPDQVITLTGTGVDALLTWAPNPLDCGYLTPGVEKVLEATFNNVGPAPVKLSNLTTSLGDFRVVSAQPVTVPARGSAKVAIAVKPAGLGPRNARLDFSTDLPKQPAGVLQLKCYGGGPDIDGPASLDFGRVAFFAGPSSSYVVSKVTIANVGTRPVPPDSRANLHLGSGGLGFWSVRVKTGVPGNTAMVEELCVGGVVSGMCTNAPVIGTYDTGIGIEASGNRALLDVPVRVTPRSPGLKEWEVLVHSDDPDEPQFLITVRAEAVAVPPCSSSVLPQLLNFGLVASGSTRELALEIANLGTGECLISGVELGAGTHPAFSLVGGPVAAQTLAVGTKKTVMIRFAPTGATPATLTDVAGTLELYVSTPGSPLRTIPLTATLGASCISIVPHRFHFGTIQKMCSSATRTFLLYNTCAAPLEIVASTLVLGSSEFTAVNTAGLTSGTLIHPGSSPATFSLKYQPVDEGSDSGAFVVTIKQGLELVDYVIPLSGAGDSQGFNSDTLLTGGNLKADILLVIDNSGSMSDKQMSLGAGFPSFIAHASSVGLDYQIGVTSSDMGVEGGRLVGAPKLLTFSMPNLNALFSSRVQLGTGGSSTEQLLAPATAAVTAPLVGTDNAGLVRPGATLGIVSVSDADDQSPQTVSFYVNQLLNVKPPGQLTFSAIAPLQATSPTPGCAYDGPGGAPRTVAAAAALDGMTREICTPDWSQGLLDLGPSVFGSVFGKSSFALANIPDLTAGKTISVKVNGVAVAPVAAGGGTVWSFDPTVNRLIFEPSYVPGPGAAVTATYFVACIP